MRKPTEQLLWEEFNLTQDEIDALESQKLKDESIRAIEKEGIAWLFDSDYWYNIAVLMVAVSFILHGVNDYIVGKHKARGTVIILLSVLFTLYNLLRIFFL
ncbi:hypothetical protein ASE46_25005 [Bacillus sp. Root239]|nr:hypothetical protein ASE46_25005 [Bacillus sp. Root239]